jgi:DNA-binding CsgD family transcriptional regulator
MARTASRVALDLARHFVPDQTIGQQHGLLSALFQSSAVGVAICDRQLRFRAVNDALASMNGIPAAAHIGQTIHAVLGSAAAKVQPAFEHVFTTGQLLSNFELTAELPSRRAIGHWNGSYFPIKDHTDQVQHVGAIVLELTKRNGLEASLLRLADKLTSMHSALSSDLRALAPGANGNGGNGCRALGNVFARSLGLLESCLAETRAFSQLLHDAPPSTELRPIRSSHVRRRELVQGKDFAAIQPIEGELNYLGPLSSREREVVALLAIGKTNKEIAEILVISTRTVESHRAKIMLKLGLHCLSDLVRYAVRSRLIDA